MRLIELEIAECKWKDVDMTSVGSRMRRRRPPFEYREWYRMLSVIFMAIWGQFTI